MVLYSFSSIQQETHQFKKFPQTTLQVKMASSSVPASEGDNGHYNTNIRFSVSLGAVAVTPDIVHRTICI